MLETLFILSSVLMSSTFAVDLDTCTEYKRDFVYISEFEAGRLIFDYKDYEVNIQILTNGQVPDKMLLAIAYGVPVPNCIPIE